MAKQSIGNGSIVAILIVIIGGLIGFQLINGGIIIDSSSEGVQSSVHQKLTDQQLVYTKHASCRMNCREISKSEVENILRTGKVNEYKSDEFDKPCPSYAIEGTTNDGQTVRIVFADCNNATKVITAIDLKNEYDCYCP